MSYQKIKNAIESRQALLVLGAGTTIQSVHAESKRYASWSGLIESGIEYVREHVDSSDDAWLNWVKGDLARADQGSDALIMAAQKVQGKLKGGHFREWLADSIGALTTHDERLFKAIRSLHAPIATTNYDTLIDKFSGVDSVTWKEPALLQQALSLRFDAIIHLHGVWTNPDSVIFSAESYGRIIGNEAAQMLQSAAFTTKTWIFIGAGDTVSDPNLGQLVEWISREIPDSANFHYLLCRAEELAELQDKYHGTCIVPVKYGSNYPDIIGYLSRIGKECWSGSASESVKRSTASLNAIADRIRNEVIISSHNSSDEVLSVDDLLIPPVLIPAAHEEVVNSAREEGGRARVRCDVKNDARASENIVVISEEAAGLTSALEWLIHERARSVGNLVPVIVDFSALSRGARPLERAIRRELNEMDISVAPGEQLPNLVVAIDNVISVRNPSSDLHKRFERMLVDLQQEHIHSFVIGCRPGGEIDINQRLESVGIDLKLRYIGQINFSDAKKLARLVAPSRATELAKRAFSIVDRENLSRTPMTMALLFDVLLRGEVTLATASDTALLDAYVSLLLGRGNPYDDARVSLDSLEREAILATLAERFVRESAGSLSQSDTISTFENLFEEVGWSDIPTEILENLKSRHILSYSRGQVKFSQASFLHLFAAKRAMESSEFKEFLLSKPLYYAPIISHYAALTRNDDEVLKRVGELVAVDLGAPPEGGRILRAYSEEDLTLQNDDLEDFVSAIVPAAGASSSDSCASEKSLDSHENDDEVGLYYDDFSNPKDRDPFPASNVDEAPPLMKAIAALSLVSNVLRDSELVRNVQLKQEILKNTLFVWGRLVEILDTDAEMQRFATDLASDLADEWRLEGDKRAELTFDVSASLGLMVGYSVMSSNLASRKLIKSLDACFADEGFTRQAGGSVMGSMLAHYMRENNWTEKFLITQSEHPSILAVHWIFWKFAFESYRGEQSLSVRQMENIEEFMANREIRRLGIANRSLMEAKRREVRQKLRKARSMSLAEGAARRSIEKARKSRGANQS